SVRMSSSRLLLLIFLLVSFVVFCDSVKLSPEMERCAEQLIREIAKEPNVMIKDAIIKIMKHVQTGALGEAQQIVRGIPEPTRSASIDKYMLGECVPMKSCLECPVEL
ncbi:hypothetical protein PMAYCL1PPCAC_14816, partial [Pristionchus mayeri]